MERFCNFQLVLLFAIFTKCVYSIANQEKLKERVNDYRTIIRSLNIPFGEETVSKECKFSVKNIFRLSEYVRSIPSIYQHLPKEIFGNVCWLIK